MMRRIPFNKTRTYSEQLSLDLTAAFQKCDFFYSQNMLQNIIETLQKHDAKHCQKVRETCCETLLKVIENEKNNSCFDSKNGG